MILLYIFLFIFFRYALLSDVVLTKGSNGVLNLTTSSFKSVELGFVDFSIIRFNPGGKSIVVSTSEFNETISDQRSYLVNSNPHRDHIEMKADNNYILPDRNLKIRSISGDCLVDYRIFTLKIIDDDRNIDYTDGIEDDFLAVFINDYDLNANTVRLYLQGLRLFKGARYTACIYNETLSGYGKCVSGEVDSECFSDTEGDNPEQCRTRNVLFEGIEQNCVFVHLIPEEGADYRIVLDVSFKAWVFLVICLPAGLLACFLCVICACCVSICVGVPILIPGCCGCINSWVVCKCHKDRTSRLWIAVVLKPIEYIRERKSQEGDDSGGGGKDRGDEDGHKKRKKKKKRRVEPNILETMDDVDIEDINFCASEIKITLEDRQIHEGNMLEQEEQEEEQETSCEESSSEEEDEDGDDQQGV